MSKKSYSDDLNDPKVRRGLVKAFRKARAFLWDGNTEMHRGVAAPICSCIYLSYMYHQISHQQMWVAQGVVMGRLSPAMTLPGWLETEQGVRHDLLTPTNVQAHRNQWLDLLIKEFLEPPAKGAKK